MFEAPQHLVGRTHIPKDPSLSLHAPALLAAPSQSRLAQIDRDSLSAVQKPGQPAGNWLRAHKVGA